MKKLIMLVSGFSIILAASLSSDVQNVDSEKIAGSWLNGNFYYTFDTGGVMRAVKIDSDPYFYQTYKFELISMDGYEFIRYGKDLSENAPVQFLYVSAENESIVTFAYGTPFVRADSSEGLIGEWVCVDGYTALTWTIGRKTIDYTQSLLDLDTGTLVPVETHHGTYSRGNRMDDKGWYFLNFDDGTQAVVLPILYKDILYMFDLNRSRARFLLTDGAPSYTDYKTALQKETR